MVPCLRGCRRLILEWSRDVLFDFTFETIASIIRECEAVSSEVHVVVRVHHEQVTPGNFIAGVEHICLRIRLIGPLLMQRVPPTVPTRELSWPRF